MPGPQLTHDAEIIGDAIDELVQLRHQNATLKAQYEAAATVTGNAMGELAKARDEISVLREMVTALDGVQEEANRLQEQLAAANEAKEKAEAGRLAEQEARIRYQAATRVQKLEGVLEQIKSGGWSGSGDRQGATYAELRAMKMAEKALDAFKEEGQPQ